MAAVALRKDEAAALIVAAALHAALFAWLAFYRPAPEPAKPPERMVVSLEGEPALQPTAPKAAAPAPAPASAPEIGEAPPPPAPEPAPASKPKPVEARPAPVPPVKVAVRPAPRPVPTAPPAPLRPAPRPAPSARPAPNPRPAATPARTASAPRPAASGRPGAQRVGPDFLPARPAAASGPASPYLPAAQIGANVRSSLAGAIARELKPRWVAPQGAEAERLVTILTWDLNPDGTLAGSPRVVRQDGITDANRAQAPRHAEQAIRAVRLAAPFDLPEQFYNAWRHVAEFRFDRRLSQ